MARLASVGSAAGAGRAVNETEHAGFWQRDQLTIGIAETGA
jgi:hypothetical protein